MTDTGKTILVERKYSLYTNFLDTILQSEGVIQEGETRQQALMRVHDELDATAQALRNRFEAGNPTTGTDVTITPSLKKEGTLIIDKSIERLEIAIDNATTHAELNKIKEENQFFPARLLDAFNKKRREIIETS